MSELTAVIEPVEAVADAAPEAGAPEAAAPGTEDVAIADLLVEEVSIDGMCGVY
jgi:mycofactocin precursor